MIGEISQCGGICFRGDVQSEFAEVIPGIFCSHREVAGVTFLAVFGTVCEKHVVFRSYFRFPYLVLETFGTTVQGVGAVVDGEVILFAVEREQSEGYAVGTPSGNLAGTGAVVVIVRGVGIAEHYVGHVAGGIRHYGRDYARTKRRQHHLGAGVVCEGIECDVSFDRGVFLACYFHCRFIRRCDVLRRK